MTGLSRRECLQGLGLAALGPALYPFIGKAVAGEQRSGAALAVFDARWPASRERAAAARLRIETGSQHRSRWFELRHAPLPAGGLVVGVSTWGDWTIVRGMLSGRGLRVLSETRRPDGLFEWAMR